MFCVSALNVLCVNKVFVKLEEGCAMSLYNLEYKT